jgi:hypothetical protein
MGIGAESAMLNQLKKGQGETNDRLDALAKAHERTSARTNCYSSSSPRRRRGRSGASHPVAWPTGLQPATRTWSATAKPEDCAQRPDPAISGRP